MRKKWRETDKKVQKRLNVHEQQRHGKKSDIRAETDRLRQLETAG